MGGTSETERHKKERPRVLAGKTYRIPSGHGTLFVTVNWDEHGNMFEVFGQLGKAGSSQRAEIEEVARLCSLALRFDVPVDELIGQLIAIQGGDPVWHEGRQITSVGDALAKILEQAKAEGPPFSPEQGGVPCDIDGPGDTPEQAAVPVGHETGVR